MYSTKCNKKLIMYKKKKKFNMQLHSFIKLVVLVLLISTTTRYAFMVKKILPIKEMQNMYMYCTEFRKHSTSIKLSTRHYFSQLKKIINIHQTATSDSWLDIEKDPRFWNFYFVISKISDSIFCCSKDNRSFDLKMDR